MNWNWSSYSVLTLNGKFLTAGNVLVLNDFEGIIMILVNAVTNYTNDNMCTDVIYLLVKSVSHCSWQFIDKLVYYDADITYSSAL